MPVVVPLQPVASQTVSVALNNQACTINVYTMNDFLFCDLLVSDAPIISGVICQNLNVIVRDLYLGFTGDIAFADTQGSDDPVYTGLGTRWILVYFYPADLPAGIN